MSQVPGISPLDESDLADQLRFDPVAFLHLFRSQRIAPSRGPFLGQVFERTVGSSYLSESREDFVPILGTNPSFTFATKMSRLF